MLSLTYQLGAFTPGCSVRHLPGYIEKYGVFKEKGVDIVAVIAFNDAWVMDAWRKANGVKEGGIVCLFSFIVALVRCPRRFQRSCYLVKPSVSKLTILKDILDRSRNCFLKEDRLDQRH